MQNIQISFYVLSASKAQDILGFICQLTQTALNKSSQSLLILSDNEELIDKLDEALWSADAVSFIPHQCLLKDNSDAASIQQYPAPVLLSTYLPKGFDGIVMNITPRPVNDFVALTSDIRITRILEIIQPDATSVQKGREKYKHYQQLGYELTHFKV